MISYKVKGIILAVIISLASIMMPFSVYAAVQSTIVPTFSSSTSQWSTHLSITNFSDGTNNQASSTLAFTFDDDYYGVVYFDGYGPSNQHIANFATVYIAGGYGEYRYSYYQNGVINITSVSISIVNVVKPQTTVDLTQIITLLTAIENDTSSIDNLLDTTLAQIRLVLNELIESNGYLEILTNIRQWDIPFESYPWAIYLFRKGRTITEIKQYNYFNLPVYQINNGNLLLQLSASTNPNVGNGLYEMVFMVSANVFNVSTLQQYFNFNDGTITDFKQFNYFYDGSLSWSLVYFKIGQFTANQYVNMTYQNASSRYFIPIYYGYDINKNISTDFALNFGLTNTLLDNIELIANGTSSSNSAASDLDDASSDYSSIADDVVGVENGLTTNFETEVNKIDLNTGLNVFGGYFLTSATWVRTQFDRLTENTPYGSMVVYGLTLGFALLMLGKVFL